MGEPKRLPVTVAVDVDELREWAGRHADAGHHGVAHALYQAAAGVESITEQHDREARAEAWDEGAEAMEQHWACGNDEPSNPYREGGADRVSASLEAIAEGGAS